MDDFQAAEKLRILIREVEPLDWMSIERIAAGDLRANGVRLRFPEMRGTDLVDDIAAEMKPGGPNTGGTRDAFLAAIVKRINDLRSRNSTRLRALPSISCPHPASVGRMWRADRWAMADHQGPCPGKTPSQLVQIPAKPDETRLITPNRSGEMLAQKSSWLLKGRTMSDRWVSVEEIAEYLGALPPDNSSI